MINFHCFPAKEIIDLHSIAEYRQFRKNVFFSQPAEKCWRKLLFKRMAVFAYQIIQLIKFNKHFKRRFCYHTGHSTFTNQSNVLMYTHYTLSLSHTKQTKTEHQSDKLDIVNIQNMCVCVRACVPCVMLLVFHVCCDCVPVRIMFNMSRYKLSINW